MALRVLLADESSSIKKVMQLALQDFGVEVKAVPLGIDVLQVAKSWNPDIVFVDVLLAKKSGYDVCAELKADKQTAKLPLVLIWSSFMDIDEKKAASCGAAKRLEKPFDADTLRNVITELVPHTASNTISSYLSFPNLPDFVEKHQAPPPHLTSDVAEIDDEPEDFSQVPLPKVGGKNDAPMASSTDAWPKGNLDRFKIHLPNDEFGTYDDKVEDIDSSPISLAGANNQTQEIQLGDLDQLHTSLAKPSETADNASTTAVDPAMVEQMVREHVRSVLQDIAWKIIPDMTERIVREEIQKLLKDAEKI